MKAQHLTFLIVALAVLFSLVTAHVPARNRQIETLKNPFKVSSAYAILPFGGLILDSHLCTCGGNFRLLIGPPSPGYYDFRPGASILFAYGQVFRAGPWTLGTYVPGGSCLKVNEDGCDSDDPQPIFTVVDVGTSL